MYFLRTGQFARLIKPYDPSMCHRKINYWCESGKIQAKRCLIKETKGWWMIPLEEVERIFRECLELPEQELTALRVKLAFLMDKKKSQYLRE